MNDYEKITNFVWEELCENGKHDNAIPYDEESFVGGKNVRIVFNRDHRNQYNRLLAFCAANDLTVVSTTPGTLSTIVRTEH